MHGIFDTRKSLVGRDCTVYLDYTELPQDVVGSPAGSSAQPFQPVEIAPLYSRNRDVYGLFGLCLAEGLQKDGQLLTIEKNPELEEPVRAFFSRSTYATQLELRIGNALEILPSLRFSPDLVFLDADKEEYPAYFRACAPLMPTGALLLADNVLWGGKVLNKAPADKETRGIRTFTRMISESEDWDTVMLPIRDGLLVAQKK